MGRWGHRLFQSDNDADIAVEIIDEIVGESDLPDSAFGLDTEHENQILEQVRQKLDAGTGETLLERSLEGAQTKDPEDFLERKKYRPIALSAILMMAGAKISDEHVGRLRAIALHSPGPESYVLPLAGDNYFRGPDKKQYLAALDHYRQGLPCDFHKPTCHACGEVGCDLGRELLKCGGCRNRRAAAWFCDKDCQKRLWKIHKTICGDGMLGPGTLNV
ncbi:hypothetical protein C8A03DRAFT_39523 [Achaetomium macrosporum]|uniref:MYND-type domain-containing protein n=1 Tax=Achaetomium macrosporum TaxID=79813 RepID=A0AAN7H2X9_9PEZI|nr:hypothetical protein C8A03DRAFT_39523 [Achaetomium macrosporum]